MKLKSIVCPVCKKAMTSVGVSANRRFCSDRCKKVWHKSNQLNDARKAAKLAEAIYRGRMRLSELRHQGLLPQSLRYALRKLSQLNEEVA